MPGRVGQGTMTRTAARAPTRAGAEEPLAALAGPTDTGAPGGLGIAYLTIRGSREASGMAER